MMKEMIVGFEDGKRWVAGIVPVKNNLHIKIDTRDGTGIVEIIDYMADFVSFQAAKMDMPSMSAEDLIQEMNMIIILALSEYDVSKEANLITFLQNHVKNRIINLYKKATQQCRTAIHENYKLSKVLCPSCHQYNVLELTNDIITHCFHCGFKKETDEIWRQYPIPIGIISSNEVLTLADGTDICIQDCMSYEGYEGIVGHSFGNKTSDIIDKVALTSAYKRATDEEKNIIKLYFLGNSISEIADTLGITMGAVKGKINMFYKLSE